MFQRFLNRTLRHTTLALSLMGASALWAQTPSTEVQWLGQSAFKITTPGGKTVITDPWLKANPLTPPEYKNLENLGKVDVLLVSHAHWDHFADAPALALMHNVKVWKNPSTGKDEAHVGGEPLGFIITLENGFKIYHMGDTGLFGDMKLIADFYKPDLVLIPIGGNFTMGPSEAAYALKAWFKPQAVIPMHYGANPLAKGTAAQFVEAMKGSGIPVLALKPGERAKF